MLSPVITFFRNRLTPRDSTDKDGLDYYRESILLYALFIAAGVGLLAYMAGLLHFIRADMWGIVILDTFAYGLVLILFLARQLSLFVRGACLVMVSYILGVYLLYKVGIYGPGFIWLFAFPVMAGLILGFRMSMVALGLTVVSIIGIGYLVTTQTIHWSFIDLDLTERVIAIGTDFFLLCLGVTIPIGFILNRLSESLISEKQSRYDLEKEVSERHLLEEELLKTRKLESVGVLAGGIAHDFNNLLTTIMGNLTLALHRTTSDDARYGLLKDAEKASLHARGLTLQLLTFSKGGNPIKELASIEDVIHDSVDFIVRGSKVRCRFQCDENLKPVEIDTGQISQVIQNIVINAVQAMPNGGDIDVSVANVTPDSRQLLFLTEDNYLKITIKDNGPGIPDDVIDRIFDPYYTTKAQGNGLGLAITHTIILKHKGHISVASELGEGTTFTLYLPASEKEKPFVVKEETVSPSQGQGRVMIMDDEEMIRDMVETILLPYGYEVVQAENGEEAVFLYKEQPVDLIIMDLTIPGGMGGKDAMQEIKKIDPSAKAIVSSGYSNDPIMANYADYGFIAAISKPYQFKTLLKVVADVLA